MFRVSRKRMIWLSRGMATMLDAGLPVSRMLTVLSGQAPPGRLRRALVRARERVEGGATLTQALEEEGCFPPLFLNLVAAGEASGTLERTVGEVARFFELQQRLWRSFLARIALPALQYVAAVAIVAVVMYVLAGLGMPLGDPKALLLMGYGIPLGLVAAYVFFLKPLGGSRAVHEVLLVVPILGGVSRSLALARFSLVMRLLMEAGSPIDRTLEQAFEATGNEAFVARGRRAVESVKEGETLTESLGRAAVFPRVYLDIVEVAEESGKLSERFDWLADEHSRRAEFALAALARAAAVMVWIAVACVIISFIIRIFLLYIGALESVMDRGV